MQFEVGPAHKRLYQLPVMMRPALLPASEGAYLSALWHADLHREGMALIDRRPGAPSPIPSLPRKQSLLFRLRRALSILRGRDRTSLAERARRVRKADTN
jgi:hypothetical protein